MKIEINSKRTKKMDEKQTYWRHCGSCKKEIKYNAIYQVCNVSSCKKLVFCSVDCWDLHNPVMNHKSSWAEENRAPKAPTDVDSEATVATPRRILVTTSGNNSNTQTDHEILIVASKLKQYVKDKHDMNTSANVMEILSKHVRRLSDRAVERAKSEGRKTLMDRDFE
jgi:histone H3/H4